MTQKIRILLASVFVITVASLSMTVHAQTSAVSLSKQAVDLDNGALTVLEVGQVFRYNILWNCSFTTPPPPEGCGDFDLIDVLPEGLEFEGCSTTGDYTCVNNAGTVEIDKIGGDSGINLGEGESSQAIITVRLSSSTTDFSSGEFPESIVNTAVVESGQPTVTSTATTPVNPPENNWTISKVALIPSEPLNPALDNNAIYRIEVCPEGPAGLGTGTIPLSNVLLTDSCEVGATFIEAELNGAPLLTTGAPNDMCPNLEFNIGDIDPADGCQVVDVTLQYPSLTFTEDQTVTNTATAVGDEGDVGICDAPCSNVVEQEISPPNPDGNISKGSPRSELAVGALSQYSIGFNLNDSNVSLNNVVINDVFPTNITVANFNFNGWDDNAVLATITELGTNTIIGPNPYDGSTNISASLDPAATGFEITFLSPIPPGFQTNSNISLEFRVDSEPASSDFINCVTLSATELATPSESCEEIDIIGPRADISSIKDIPAALNPGEEFTATFSLRQDRTSSTGAINPIIVECLPEELIFVSWDTVDFPLGLDDPREAINLTNDRSLGVLPNLEVFAPGDPGNNCTAGGGMLRWSWSTTAPSGSLQLGNAPGVNNPFTFPAYPDRNGDNLSTSADTPLGENSRVDIGVTLQVVPGTLAVSGLSNTAIVQPEIGSYACNVGASVDSQDLDGDGLTDEVSCQDTESFDVLSSAGIGANKFVEGFPGLENIDPANPPANINAADAGIEPAFCPDDGSDRTRAPCVAQGLASQPFNYVIRMSNDGNVPLVDYIAYDILPYAGDVGITENQSTTARGSTWTPELLGPVVLSSVNPVVQAELDRIGDLTIPDATRPRIE